MNAQPISHVDSNTLVAQHVVWNERRAQWITLSLANSETRYQIEMLSATFCKSCNTKAVVASHCRSCGLDQSATDYIKWD